MGVHGEWRFGRVKRWEGSVAVCCAVIAALMVVLAIYQFATIGSMGVIALIIALGSAGSGVHYASVWWEKRWDRRARRSNRTRS